MPAFYRQIMDDIRDRIAAGEWAPGDPLPSTRELTDYYKERIGARSPATIRQAITILIESGVLRGQQGLAVYVADGRPTSD